MQPRIPRANRAPQRAVALVSAALALCAIGVPRGSSAQASTVVDDRQVKAAFLYNFTKFVEWPHEGSGALVIGITGDDEFATIVEAVMRGRKVRGRDLTTRRLAAGEDPSDCQVVFISGARPREAAEALQRSSGPILTVGETPSFLREGGVVRFVSHDRHVRFEIDQKNATARGLKISSHLLTLAAR